MQFTVPQFIDQEDKIFFFLTVRQFIILIVGAVLIAVLYKLLSFNYFLGATVFIALSAAFLAFAKHNGRPIHFFLISLIEGLKKPSLRVWNKELFNSELKFYLKTKEEEPQKSDVIPKRQYSGSQLSQLSLIVDTGGGYSGEDVLENNNLDKTQ